MFNCRLAATAAMAALLVIAVPEPELLGQQAHAWKHDLGGRPVGVELTPFSTVVVELKTGGVSAFHTATGDRVWSRPQSSSFQRIAGLPYALVTQAGSTTVIDLETGEDRWSMSRLTLTSRTGFISLPAKNLLLVYGASPGAAHTLVGVNAETGEELWQNTSLYAHGALAQKAAKIRYLTYLQDTPSSVLIDPSDDGLLRLDLESGRLIWRTPDDVLKSGRHPLALFFGPDVVYAAHDRRLFAVAPADGRLLWRKEKLPVAPAQVEATEAGLLIRGSHTFDNKGRTKWRPFLALLDPSTGATTWTTEKTKFEGRSPFLVEGNAVVVATKASVITFDLATGKPAHVRPMPELEGGEAACCIERRADGRLMITASQNVRMIGATGTVDYSTYFKAPGASFLSKFATVALAVVASSASMGLAGPGGMYSTYSPNASVFTRRFKATTNADQYLYVFTEESGSRADRFVLVRLDKESGKDTGRLRFSDRSPNFRVDPATGDVIVVDGSTIAGLKFPQEP